MLIVDASIMRVKLKSIVCGQHYLRNESRQASFKVLSISGVAVVSSVTRSKLTYTIKLLGSKFVRINSPTLVSFYPPTKSERYSFGVVRASIPSVRTFCPSGTISQYLSVRFDSFLVKIISTMDSQSTISLVKIDPLTLELLPLF